MQAITKGKDTDLHKMCTRWQIEGYPEVYTYPWSGHSIRGMSAKDIRNLYMTVGRAWEEHTYKQQDLGSADTTHVMRYRLKYWFSFEAERAWIEYALTNEKFNALRNGRTRLVKI
jgi:hypothetical protein